jgi:hypothetical protein
MVIMILTWHIDTRDAFREFVGDYMIEVQGRFA